MAHYVEDECVGCPPEMGCLGTACPNRNVMHCYCDKCGDDVPSLKDLFVYENSAYPKWKELCEECYTERMLIEAERVDDSF